MAERQTRWLQVPVSERACGFKSRLAHRGEAPVLVTGAFAFPYRPARYGATSFNWIGRMSIRSGVIIQRLPVARNCSRVENS